MRIGKAFTAIIVAVFLCFAAAGCGGKKPNNNGGGENGGDVTANFTVNGNSAVVRWNGYAGATGYSVEKAQSRYGDYEFIDYVSADKTEYTASDVSAYYKITALLPSGESVTVGTYSYETELFGNNTYVYAPTDDMQSIQADFDSFYEMTYDESNGVARGEFRSERFAALFKSGEYDISADVGYYTALYGMGNSPDDVTLKGMNVTSPVSLCNFWRTAENLKVNGNVTWAVSQATSLRRIHVAGKLDLWGANIRENSTSGGFIADVKVDGAVSSGTQQQFLTRNSDFGSWSGGVWNMAFVGVDGNNIPANSWSGTGNNYTNIQSSGALREKPFLTYSDTLGYRVFVPEVTSGASGVSWGGNSQNGSYIPLSDFYVARSDKDTSATINAALKSGKNLILTAGIYQLESPLEIANDNAVVLGLGLATLRPKSGNTDTLIRVKATAGVCIGGILLDAGTHTETLLEVGDGTSGAKSGSADSPVTLSDLFFRVGGWTTDSTYVDACAVINTDNVIGDNLWIWRADHSAVRSTENQNLFNGISWENNAALNGIIVNGDNATFYGLFVEHFLQYQTVFRGNGCTTYFYQSELPYDVPDAESWTPDGVACGYASYYVDEGVTTHTAYALGVYSFLRDSAVTLDSAIICPQTSGINFTHLITVWLSGNADSEISAVINGEGNAATNQNKIAQVQQYPA